MAPEQVPQKKNGISPNAPSPDSGKKVPSPQTESSVGNNVVDSENSVSPATRESDLQALQNMDWIGATLKRFRTGKHPDPHIESLLDRRLNISRQDHLAPYLVRMLVSMALVFTVCTAAWVFLWAIGSLLQLNSFLIELSYGMVFLLIALFGIAMTNPVNLYDEPSIEKAGKTVFDELQREIEEETSGPHSTNSHRSAPSSESKKS